MRRWCTLGAIVLLTGALLPGPAVAPGRVGSSVSGSVIEKPVVLPESSFAGPPTAADPTPPPCAGWADRFAPPPTIRVGHRVSGATASIGVVTLRAYVEHALATSWPPATPPAALAAAALAIKQAAWFQALEPQFDDNIPDGTCFDVRDDIVDLRYDPTATVAPEHVAAVDATWTLTLRRTDLESPFFLPRIRDDSSESCGQAVEPLHVVLPRRGVVACALAGESSGQILQRYLGPGLAVLDVTELAGPSRYETAVAVSRSVTPGPPVPVVYVATGLDFPDALAVGPAAGRLHGSILLVPRNSLPAAVASELKRLRPSQIVIVGGPSVVTEAVVRQLGGYSPSVRRIAGADRYATALAIVADAFPTGPVPVVYLATGANYPDALAGASAGAHLGGPLLLVPGLAPTTGPFASELAAALARLRPMRIAVLGGSTVVSDQWLGWASARAPRVDRLAGEDRYATAAAISADSYGPHATVLHVATGTGFADALVAAPLGGPLLLAPGFGVAVDASTLAEAGRLAAPRMVVLGSEVVPDAAVTALGGASPTPASGRRLDAYFTRRDPMVGLQDAAGIPMTVYDGVARYNPVQISQWGLAHYTIWLATADGGARSVIVRMADWLVGHQLADGRWLADFAFGGQPVPWWSAMAEGQGISLLLRAYQMTGAPVYLDAAARALTTMDRTIPKAGVVDYDAGWYWLELYLPPYSRHTLNGFLYTIEGVREYAMVTGDPHAAEILTRSLATLRSWVGLFDAGSWSYYNLSPSRFNGKPYRGNPNTLHYHLVQLMQLRHFYLLTGEGVLRLYAQRWAADALHPPPNVGPARFDPRAPRRLPPSS